MEIDTKLYQITNDDKELQNIIAELDTDFTLISNLLNIGDDYEDIDIENYINDSEEYPALPSLPIEVINKINNFTQSVFNTNIALKYTPTEDVLDRLVIVRNLLSEQLYYLSSEEPECTIWLVVSKINGLIYGAACVFYNLKRSPNILMQGISRSFMPSLLEIIQPGILSTLPRLNSLLQPIVESIGRSVSAQKIYVAPIGNQGNILEKHYGFVSDKSIIFPCSMIRGEDIITKDIRRFHTYSKVITYDSTEL
ncbi:Hypothetical protein HVR_LOCUS521 [uncultured virus]|nr:Hypothetical protein HVR_LOCUS521 [uncultured virus]